MYNAHNQLNIDNIKATKGNIMKSIFVSVPTLYWIHFTRHNNNPTRWQEIGKKWLREEIRDGWHINNFKLEMILEGRVKMTMTTTTTCLTATFFIPLQVHVDAMGPITNFTSK
jgi:hypothetical protein